MYIFIKTFGNYIKAETYSKFSARLLYENTKRLTGKFELNKDLYLLNSLCENIAKAQFNAGAILDFMHKNGTHDSNGLYTIGIETVDNNDHIHFLLTYDGKSFYNDICVSNPKGTTDFVIFESSLVSKYLQ